METSSEEFERKSQPRERDEETSKKLLSAEPGNPKTQALRNQLLQRFDTYNRPFEYVYFGFRCL